MCISDLPDYDPKPTEVAKEFLHENRRKHIKSEIEQLVDEEFDRLEEDADDFISQTAAERAKRFLQRVLNGDGDAAMALLGDKLGGQRYRLVGCDKGNPWARIIHGRLFETVGIAMRKAIVESNPELLQNERILDLESIIDGLSAQIRELKLDLDRLQKRLRQTT